MATVIESKQKPLDIDSIAEYVRDEDISKPQTKSYAKDLIDSASEVLSKARAIKTSVLPAQADMAGQTHKPGNSVDIVKPDVLETLWPGIHHDFSHSLTAKRAPNYYLTLGFLGGAVIVLILAGGYSLVTSLFSNFGKVPSNITENKASSTTVASDITPTTGVRVPLVAAYEVQEGDTLAAIALANYKHVSPRLLDEICKANNLTDANILNSGQKLTLPEYHY